MFILCYWQFQFHIYPFIEESWITKQCLSIRTVLILIQSKLSRIATSLWFHTPLETNSCKAANRPHVITRQFQEVNSLPVLVSIIHALTATQQRGTWAIQENSDDPLDLPGIKYVHYTLTIYTGSHHKSRFLNVLALLLLGNLPSLAKLTASQMYR